MLNIFFSPYLNSMHPTSPRLSPLSSTKQAKKVWALRSEDDTLPPSYSLFRK